ncbi:hypothetical protein F4801DRAFT_343956 [Xylaria longipes]|nr:hypothetical protein F4801DRAFT_343956 [Xylaria longipes]
MSSSARARGGPARPSLTQPTTGSKGSRSVSVNTTRRAMKEKKKEVIIIESDESDVSDYAYVESGGSDVDGDAGENGEAAVTSPRSVVLPERSRRIVRASTAGLPTPHQSTFSTVRDHAVPETPTKKTHGRPLGRIAALVRNTDTTLRMPDTPSTLAPSSSLDGPHSSMKDSHTLGRRLLHTSSTVAPFSSPHGIHMSQPRSSGMFGAHEKADTNIRTLQQKPNSTPASVAVTNSKGALPRSFSSALPPAFLPAVKPRVYSASRSGGKRNFDIGSKKLEAFGFVSATSLLPATTKLNATTVPPIANRPNAAPAIAPTPIVKSEPVPIPTHKPSKQEEVQILGGNRESPPRATRNLAAVATSSPISKFTPRPIKQEAVEVQISVTQPLPRTPEKPIPTKRPCTPSYSTGTYGDPYAISSDSDSDDDDGDNYGNDNGKSHNPPPLKSFAEIADTHETASDVEAVLNQFPTWLDSPSPTELRSSYLGTSQSTPSSRPGKGLWGDGVGNRDRMGRVIRRVRFGEGDGFSTSPVPAKRVTAPSPFTSCVDGVPSPVERNTSPSRLTRTSSPTRQVTPVKRANSLMGETPSTKRTTFTPCRLTPARQTAPLDKCDPSPTPIGRTTPRVEITMPNSESGSDLNEDSNSKLNFNPNNNRRANPIRRQESVVRGDGTRKQKKKKKKGTNKEHKLACRHRNRYRESWRRVERAKGRINVTGKRVSS